MLHATAHLARTAHIAQRRPVPYVFRIPPRRPAARRWAETAWALYPPTALMLAALMLAAGGCRGGESDPYASSDRAGAQLARQNLVAVESAGTPQSHTEAPGRPPTVHPPYPTDMPLAGEAAARATARYGKDRLDLANLSKLPWTETRVWVNGRYSALLPYTKPGDIRSIHFSFLVDDEGRTFPTSNRDVRIEQVELITGDERTHVRLGLGY